MAGSATPRPADPPPVVAVAFSGGSDSTALLWATARQAKALGVAVVALHVHHGLMPQADHWVAHAHDFVRRLGEQGYPVRLLVTRLEGAPAPGDSVEAWARRHRYPALAELARQAGADLVLVAQHADDQAETVLLQALRGGGPAGLAAMPARWQRLGLTWARPWLHRRKCELQAVVAASDWVPVVDASNDDPRFARSRLRQTVMPALVAAFPHAVEQLAEVARQAAHARALAAEVAGDDLLACCAADGGLRHGDWALLTPARRRNVLKSWLQAHCPNGVPESLVERLTQEWAGLGRRWPLPDGWVQSQARVLRVIPSSAANPG